MAKLGMSQLFLGRNTIRNLANAELATVLGYDPSILRHSGI
jgi:hypothetical protein